MHLSFQAVVLAALALESTVAQPAHRHAHFHKRELVDLLKRDGSDPWNQKDFYTGVDWSSAVESVQWSTVFNQGKAAPTSATAPANNAPAVQASPTQTSSPAVNAASSSAAPASSSSASASSSQSASSKPSGSSGSSGGSGSCVDISAVWSKGDTSSNGPTAATVQYKTWTDKSSSSSKEKRATAEQDGYVGNTGSSNYGTNIIPLSDCNNQDHTYSIKFTNSYPDQRDMAVMIWNKVGANGQPQSGPFSNSFFMIDLPAGKSAAFAFEANSQIAFSESSSTCQRQSSAPGGWNCIWGEANFGPVGGGFTSWDVSVMLNPSGVPGHLSISNNGSGISSRATCGFMNAAQEWAGQGQTVCNPNSNGPARLSAQFGLDLS